MTPRRYLTPDAFKQALETRLRSAATQQGISLNRMRQRLIFERFLVLNPAPDGDTIEGAGIIYEGRRFRVNARLAGRPYGDPFGVDAAFGDLLTGDVEHLDGSDLLSFAGITSSRLRVYPRETHVAEKLHAYTLPRDHENSRVKDLPDIAPLAQTGTFDRGLLRAALVKTFSFRGSHPLPGSMPPPPAFWADAYARMARAHRLPWPTLADVYRAAGTFLDPVLSNSGKVWNPDRWTWD